MLDFKKNNPIELLDPVHRTLPPQILSTGEPILPHSAVPFIEKALNINIFQPDSLTPAQLRAVIGLEVSNHPVPEGVYLIRDDTGLSGIFVQGDCDEMILAIDRDRQIIFFAQGEFEWILLFSPIQQRTEFHSPAGTQIFDGIPLGIILINGAVRSLGGGHMDSSGEIEIALDEESPCLLDGVNLTLVCSDEIVLSSHLILEGVKWQDGIPYIKDSKAMLNIFATGEDFLDGTEKKGQIAVEKNAPQELKIHASLTASGEGFSIEGENRTVQLLGSLQTSDYTSNGNTLKAKWDNRFIYSEGLLDHSPRSTRPLLSILSLQALAWNDEPKTIEN
jgi:hypothetical protein